MRLKVCQGFSDGLEERPLSRRLLKTISAAES